MTSHSGRVKRIEAPGIMNFSRIDDGIGFAGATVGFGGATQPSAMSWLKSLGFAAVINLRLATEQGADVSASRAAAQAVGLKFIDLPFDVKSPDPQLIDDFVAAGGEAANQPVHIYCNTATRVAALWMISRVLEDDWSIDSAREEAEGIAAKPAEAVAFATAYLRSRGK